MLTLIPRVTIHPDKICLYNEVKFDTPRSSRKSDLQSVSETQDINLSFLRSTRKNNGFLSDHAKRKLFRSLDYLIITSERKKVYSKIQSKYVIFRIVFVTLTLPAKQRHSDKEITNNCFNQLIIELKKYHNVKSYVWRAEKQENGNIHYHLLINEFVEWSELRKRWNRIVNKLGYIDEYQANMKKLYKNGFVLSRNPNDKRTPDQQRKAFILAQKSDFRSPNSTDIHDTRKIRDVKRYVGKYMAKQPSINLETDLKTQENLMVNGRLWSCSQNLSDIKGCQLVEDWEISDELEKVVNNSNCNFFKGSYFQVYFISIHEVLRSGSDLLFKYFSDYLIERFDFHLNKKLAL